MPTLYVLAAVQALSGAVGNNGETLALRRYYPMQEPLGITDIYDGTTNAPAGQWVGSPRLRGVYGPAENEGVSYGVDFAPAGGAYGDLGSAADALSAINGNGLFVCVAVKHVSGQDRDTMLSASDSTGAAGFRIAFNQSEAGLSGFGLEGAMFGTDLTGGTQFCGARFQNADLIYDNQWHLDMWFMKAPATIKHWIDGIPKPLQTTTNGVVGTFPTSQTRLIAGALAVGPSVDASRTYSYTGAMAHLIMVEGEPTQTQVRDLCRAMYYTVRGIPGVVAHYRPSAGTCFADVAMHAPSVEGGPVRCLADISGHANHGLYDHPTDVPTLERAINGGRWCACFDNFASAYDQWTTECRQQSLNVPASTSSTLVQTHMGCLVSVRTLASASFGKTAQELLGFRTSGGVQYNALDLYLDEPSVGRNGSFVRAENIPMVRCLPGLGVMGFTSGLRGDGTAQDALFVNNRWQSFATSAFNTADSTSPITNWNIGGRIGQHYTHGGQDMWAGWLEEAIVTKCPYLPSEGAAYVAQAFLEAEEPLVPRAHVCVVGDSIASGNREDRCRAMLGAALPIEARKFASFTNASVSGYRVRSTVFPESSLVLRGLDSPKWWDPQAKNIAAVEAIVNDANEGHDQATFTTDIDDLMTLMRAGGANVVLWNEETNNAQGPGNTPRNLALRSRVASGAIARDVILTPLPPSGYAGDGLHPSPPSQFIWAADWWGQGLSPYLKPSKSAGPAAAARPSPEQ